MCSASVAGGALRSRTPASTRPIAAHAHRRASTPTLLLHGENDRLTPPNHAEEMFRALLKSGREAELVIYPGGAHGVRREGAPAHRADIYRRIVAWFDRHLGHDR